MKSYIMALDSGTTGVRCILFDRQGKIVASAQKEFTQLYPKPGWVEHDAMEIWSTQMGVAQEAMLKIDATNKNIAAIGITNQRETTVVWDKITGEPIYNAIVWQCRRTADECQALKASGNEALIRAKTGLMVDAYFCATKLRWILQNVDGADEKARRGDLLFGTIDTWLIWRMTKDHRHVTDYSNASRTMLYNIHTLDWDDDLLTLMDIPRCMLPKVVDSSGVVGYTDASVFGGEIPIAGLAGDQQCALFGQACFCVGTAKNTYGTGCFLLMNTGDTPTVSNNGLLTTIAWGLNGAQITYALEGSVFAGGACVQWLRDELKLIETAAQSAELAQKVPDSNGVYVVPAFVGLGAPHWNQYARGAILGLTRGANRFHIVRATLEAIAFQVNDVLRAMEMDSGVPLKWLQVDGGACANSFLMQFQSDIINAPVLRPTCIESTALGAAYLAGLGVGYWANMEQIKATQEIDTLFTPAMQEQTRTALLKGWNKAVQRSLNWSNE